MFFTLYFESHYYYTNHQKIWFEKIPNHQKNPSYHRQKHEKIKLKYLV